MRIHETFQHIHEGVIERTRLLLQGNLWECPPEEAMEQLQNWCDSVVGVYDIPRVQLELADVADFRGGEGGAYVPQAEMIYLTRPSMLWLFHQFRHHMQVHGKQSYSNREADALGWSHSLMWSADRRTFCMLVSEGATEHVRPQDLPPAADPMLQSFEEIADSFMEDLDPASGLAELLAEIAAEDEQ